MGIEEYYEVVDNPNLAEKADEFVQIFMEAIKAHRFENLKMLYLGRKD